MHGDNRFVCTFIIVYDVGDELVEDCVESFTTAHIGEQSSSLNRCSLSYTSGLNKVMLAFLNTI